MQVRIRTNAVAENLVNNPNPQNAYGSKFSIQYCTAAAIRYGQVGVAEFNMERLNDPDLRRLMSVVTVAVDETLDEDFRKNPDKWSVWVTITANNGEEYQKFVAYPKGDPQNPLSYAETEVKARSLIEDVYEEGKRNALLDAISTLETTVDMSRCFDFLFGK
jgi:2-methylcitrate dehydratase PrpD